MAENIQTAMVVDPFRSTSLRGTYQRADAQMTLREALHEYNRVNPGLFELDPEKDEHAAGYYLRHDYCHIIFGTDTSLVQEAITDSWIFFGVAVSPFTYSAGFFKTGEAWEVIKQIGSLRRGLLLSWKAMLLLPRIRRRTQQMKKRWPWSPPLSYLDRSLHELRAEYGIVPLSIEETMV